ncbi:MAG: hypothetical protein WDN76_12075 [Alphaproteobacteria bacterium]
MGLAFASFEAKRMFEKDALVGEAEVWMGSKKTVKLKATEPFDVAYMRTLKDGLKTTIVYNGPLQAPVKKDAIVATLVFEGPGVARKEMPLAAAETVGGLNPISKALVGAKQMFGGS